ncbi:MAG: RagB/SusD family nutrient uptake outer membrane protein [Breznakibacter sp.]
MKKLTYISMGLLAGTLCVNTACEGFLDREPLSEITEEMLGIDPNASDSVKYTTADQAEALLKAAYQDYTGEYYQLDIYIYNENQSDNSYAGESKAQSTSIDNYTLDASNGNVSRDWRYLYNQIAKCNSVIQWVPMITDVALTSQRKNEIVGEALTIRAKCYFDLVRIYGDVPLVLEEVPSITRENIEEVYPLLYPERRSQEEVMDTVVSDLTKALAMVREYSSNKFMVSGAVVNAYLAEVYATLKPVNWEKVRDHAQAVVDDNRYGLYDNFDDNFAAAEDGSGLKNEHGKESLFEIDLNSWSTGGNWGYQMFMGTDWKKFNTPSIDLVKAFEAEGDTERMNASIFWSDVTGKWTDVYWSASNYPFCYKMRVEEKGNIVLLRLPAVILLLAEAENELGNLETARGLVDRVRNRVSLGNTPAAGKDAMRLAIEKERRLELCFEGYRWWDLKRTDRAIEVMKAAKDGQSAYSLPEYRLLWPIPQGERDTNEKLTQNSGY